jgi:hypothetical protein
MEKEDNSPRIRIEDITMVEYIQSKKDRIINNYLKEISIYNTIATES